MKAKISADSVNIQPISTKTCGCISLPALNLRQAIQAEIENWEKKEKYWAQKMCYEILQQSC